MASQVVARRARATVLAWAAVTSAAVATCGRDDASPRPTTDAGVDATDAPVAGRSGGISCDVRADHLYANGTSVPSPFPSPCDQGPVRTLDDGTVLGFSAADLVAAVAGTRRATLTWEPSPRLRATPAQGTTELTLVVRATAPPRVSEPIGGVSPDSGQSCSGRAAVDVELALRTADGALAESWTTTLGMVLYPGAALGEASFDHTLPEGAPRGTLRVVLTDARPGDRVGLALHGWVGGEGTRGQLMLGYARDLDACETGGATGEGGTLPVASWK